MYKKEFFGLILCTNSFCPDAVSSNLNVLSKVLFGKVVACKNQRKNLLNILNLDDEFDINNYSLYIYQVKNPKYTYNINTYNNSIEKNSESLLCNNEVIKIYDDLEQSKGIIARLLKMSDIEDIEKGQIKNTIEINTLPGFNGWSSLEELFFCLNRNVKWLVLRGFEDLPIICKDKDIDLLCEDLYAFVDVSYAIKRSPGISGYMVKINHEYMDLDIRFVGDGYYDPLWQRDMLLNRGLYRDVVPIMRFDDLFFSLAYHAILQKKYLTEKYKEILSSMWLSLSSEDKILTESEIVNIVNNYMIYHNYKFSLPKDKSVYLNNEYHKLIVKERKKKLPFIPLHKELELSIRRCLVTILPNNIIKYLKKIYD